VPGEFVCDLDPALYMLTGANDLADDPPPFRFPGVEPSRARPAPTTRPIDREIRK
jgi:hypothetical protein